MSVHPSNYPKDDGDVESLRTLLAYDPETGIFTWKIANSRCVKVGQIAGARSTVGYWEVRWNGGRSQKAHRVAWLYVHGRWPNGYIDHINGDRGDNRIANLREATNAENVANAPPRSDNTSGIKGVYWDRRRSRWAVRVRRRGYPDYHVSFGTLEEARLARLAKAQEIFGDFARSA